MTERVSINQLYPTRMPPGAIGPNAVKQQSRVPHQHTAHDAKSFQHVLNESILRFSHHAEQRLQQRGIELKPDQLLKLEHAVDKAAKKGAKDSLILFRDIALIVDVKNKTVVTAMDETAMADHIFTQIDSAVIVSK